MIDSPHNIADIVVRDEVNEMITRGNPEIIAKRIQLELETIHFIALKDDRQPSELLISQPLLVIFSRYYKGKDAEKDKNGFIVLWRGLKINVITTLTQPYALIIKGENRLSSLITFTKRELIKDSKPRWWW